MGLCSMNALNKPAEFKIPFPRAKTRPLDAAIKGIRRYAKNNKINESLIVEVNMNATEIIVRYIK